MAKCRRTHFIRAIPNVIKYVPKRPKFANSDKNRHKLHPMKDWKNGKTTDQMPQQTNSDNSPNKLRPIRPLKRKLAQKQIPRTSNGFTNRILRSTFRSDQRPRLNIGSRIHLQSQQQVFSNRKERTNDPSRQSTRTFAKRYQRRLQGKWYLR